MLSNPAASKPSSEKNYRGSPSIQFFLSGEDWANKHFGLKKVNLSEFSKLERNAIAMAEVKKGMSKKAVLAAYGYPPAHKTPSLEGSKWLYWITRWNKIVVTFEGDKVSNVRT